MSRSDPIGTVVRHSFFLRRHENALARDLAALFRAGGDRWRALLLDQDPQEVSRGRLPARLRSLDRAALEVLRDVYAEVAAFAGDRLVSLAEVEAEFAARLLARSAPDVHVATADPGRQQWRERITADPVQGAPLRDWWRRQREETAFAFRRQVRLGLANGEPTPEIIRRVRGRYVRPGVYEGRVMPAAGRQAEVLVRTAVNHVATRAQVETYTANRDVTREYIYTATLDERTSDICRALDGQRFRYGEGPEPPQHPNCRSAVRPVVDWKGLGLEPPPVGERAAAGGPVSGRLDYTGWLRQQPAGAQDEILGPARGRLFRAGKVTLQDLVRMDGSTLTLDQLREKIA
jgi:SPP1 gp7 family putative phage head morphogenesis protein